MSVKSCEKLDKSKVALTIEADAAAFEAAINKAYLKQRGKISVPGFRPGKAPRKMIESMYGAEVFYEEAVNILLPDAYEDAVKEQELKVVGYPEVELESCGKDGVVFKCTVAVYPEVTLGQYKGLEAPKAEVNVTDEDVENRLNEMADRNSRLVSVEREIQKGDTADIDFEGFDNGVPFDGGKGENFDLEIGSGSFVPGFEDQLVGMKAGEEKDIDITFPENYTPELAGKPVVFHVKVNEVKHKEVPAIDDEFAKDVSEFDTLEELKADTRKQLTDDREAAAQRAFEDALMQKVADGIQADIPDEMVDVQAQQMMENFQQQLAAQGIPFDQYLKMTNTTEDDFKKQAHDPAVQQVRMDLAVAALVKAENLEATAQEIEDELKTVADKYGMDLDTIKKYLPEADVREQVLRSKAIKAVADAAVAVAPVVEESQEEARQEEEKKDADKEKTDPKHDATVGPAPNALILTAEKAYDPNSGACVYEWKFNGEVYRQLANSGIEYLGLQAGDYMTALPTEGFTGGTVYTRMKMNGVATKEFEYTLRMIVTGEEEAPCSMELSVNVGEETYQMTDDEKQPMYYYDVLLASADKMDEVLKAYNLLKQTLQ